MDNPTKYSLGDEIYVNRGENELPQKIKVTKISFSQYEGHEPNILYQFSPYEHLNEKTLNKIALTKSEAMDRFFEVIKNKWVQLFAPFSEG